MMEQVATDERDAPAPVATIDFRRDGVAYRHWEVTVDGPRATVAMAVDPDGGLRPGYQLKLNSYDLGVDIELHDIVQRLRFEHPEVKAVVLTSAADRIFCAGANIQMLAGSTHHHKVNFCKFTNETRSELEDASWRSGQRWICAANGTASGGGYELALACEEIVLLDDGSSAVSLPEVPLLGVLPGTGGLTRVSDKRLVRRDRADAFTTRAEGVRGPQAVEWRLVDEVAARSRFDEAVTERVERAVATSDRPTTGPGVPLPLLPRTVDGDRITYRHVEATLDHEQGAVEIVVRAPGEPVPTDIDEILVMGADFWPLAVARELDDLLLHLRFNAPTLGTLCIRTAGDPSLVVAADGVLDQLGEHWFGREVRLLLARVLRRLDLTARTIVALVEPGSCFVGTLAELAFAADRTFMLDGTVGGEPAALLLGPANGGWYPMFNGLSRLQTRFWRDDPALDAALARSGEPLDARAAGELGLVTFTPDDLDWDDEVRVALAERASFSPDALTGMEANYRFVGPETMETKIFGRLTAWQNWIFQRPNASGPEGALRSYGTGSRPAYDPTRI